MAPGREGGVVTPSVLHVAGPLEADNIQRCATCRRVLKDCRPDITEAERRHLVGGDDYPVGANVLTGPGFQTMWLGTSGIPRCVA